jgi:hypothetical protein
MPPLIRHFFGRFFDNELVAAAAEAQVTVTQILALLTVPGMFLTMYLFPQYTALEFQPAAFRERALLVDRYLFISLSMIVVGFATVIEWDALFPDRRDYSILLALPISGRDLFAAKIVSLLGFLALFSLAVNLWSSVLFPLISLPRAAGPLLALRTLGVHLCVLFLSSACIFFFFVALQGVLLNALPLGVFRRISPYVQFAAMAALVSSLLVFPNFSGILVRLVQQAHPGLLFYPPMWFVGLYDVWLGDSRPLYRELARTGLLSLLTVTVISALSYALGYRHHARKFLESPESGAGLPRLRARVTSLFDRLWLRHPLERATFHFIRQALSRSRRHKLYLAAYVGVGTAFVVEGLFALATHIGSFGHRISPSLLSIQLDLSFFLLSGLRYVFTVPAEPAANWIFRLNDSVDRRYFLTGARKIMILVGIVPICAALLPVHVLLWGWQVAFLHLVFGAMLSLILIELLLFGFHKIPFTCYYLPGKANLTSAGILYFAAFFTYTSTMTGIESWMLGKPDRFIPFLGIASTILARIVFIRRRRVDNDFYMIYEDAPEPEIRTLDINRPRAVS